MTTHVTAANSVAAILDQIASHDSPFSRDQLSKIARAVEGKLYCMPLELEEVPEALYNSVADFYADRIVWKNGDVTDIDVEFDTGMMFAGTTIWESRTATIGPMTIFAVIPEHPPRDTCYIDGFEELAEQWKTKYNFKTDLEVCSALKWIFEELRDDHESIFTQLSLLKDRLVENNQKDA